VTPQPELIADPQVAITSVVVVHEIPGGLLVTVPELRGRTTDRVEFGDG
jgi:hypothetical protein